MMLGACASTATTRAPAASEARTTEAWLTEADAALEQREYGAAARAYRHAAEGSEDEVLAEQAARVAFENFQFEEAARSAARWLQINPSSEQAHRYAGVTALKLHRLDAAQEHFEFLLQSAYLSPAAGFLALLPVISDEGTAADVTELLRRLSDAHPEVGEGHYAVASAALRSDNFALARARAELAVAKAPYWVPAQMLRGRVKIASGDEQAGLDAIAALAGAPGADVATRLEYALLLLGTGRLQQARAVLTPYATGQTVVPGAIRALGMLELQEGNLDAASQRFEELLATGTANNDASYYLGSIAERRGDEERALRQYSRVTGGELTSVAQQRIARLKAGSDGLDAGLAHLDAWSTARGRSGPDVALARSALASAMGDETRALAELDLGLATYPSSVDLRLARAFVLERTGEVDAAVRAMRELLGERPGDAVLQNALGYTLVDRTRNYQEGYDLIVKSLAQTPDSVAVQDSMGWALYRLGRHAEALQYLEQARARTDDAEIDFHIGEVQWAMGDKDAARKRWSEALERDPDNVRLKKRLESAGS